MTRKRILIIEDDLDIGEVMQEVLEESGNEVVLAADLEGINKALKNHDKYDAYFVDNNFPLRHGQQPEMLGDEAVTLIGEHAQEHRYVPAMIFTSANRYVAREMADRYGGRPMAKPFNVSDIGIVLGFAMQAANPQLFDL